MSQAEQISSDLAGAVSTKAAELETRYAPRYHGGYLRPSSYEPSSPDLPTAVAGFQLSKALSGVMTQPVLPLTPVQRIIEPISMPIAFPSVKDRQDRFTALQRFEGVVVECSEDSFIARLTDQTTPGAPETAEFDLDDVPPPDRDLLEPGAVFYWNIGYFDSQSGQRSRVSTLRFRRLPVWSKQELLEAKERAERVKAELEWG